MKVDISFYHSDGFPSNDEMERVCKIGQGANTCIWLVAGGNGFECTVCHKPHALLEQWRAGRTIAKRDGCEAMKNLDIFTLGLGEHEVELV